jgi:hypothetical protein
MITVSFNLPTNNGGDKITSYRVQWDTVASFNGPIPAPHKGFVDLDAAQYTSWTIQVC